MISYCLGSGGWEISKKKIFHLGPCKILPCQIFVYYPITIAWVIAYSLRLLGLKATFYDPIDSFRL